MQELETLRLRLRSLARFLSKQEKAIIYSDFEDEVLEVRETEVLQRPRMTGAQYEKKVGDYLRNDRDHIVIHRLRINQPLTSTDLTSLEQMLVEIGEDDGERLLAGLLERKGNPSLSTFVRSLVGMDRASAQTAFSKFLQDRSLSAKQIRFVEMIVDQLTERGVIEPSALYEIPFTDIHHEGPDGLFAGRDNVLCGIFQALERVQPDVRPRRGEIEALQCRIHGMDAPLSRLMFGCRWGSTRGQQRLPDRRRRATCTKPPNVGDPELARRVRPSRGIAGFETIREKALGRLRLDRADVAIWASRARESPLIGGQARAAASVARRAVGL